MLARLRKSTEENKEGGFTLIELLVVMIIIGVLAAIAIPAFLSQRTKGYESSMKSDLRSIATEIQTALVDSPTAVAIGGGTAPGEAVTVGAETSNISANNSLNGAAGVNVSTGAYCVSLSSDKTTNKWTIYNAGSGASQVTVKGGTCTIAGVFAA